MKKWKVFEAPWHLQEDDPTQVLEDKLNEIERDGWNTFKISEMKKRSGFTIVAWKPSEDSTSQD